MALIFHLQHGFPLLIYCLAVWVRIPVETRVILGNSLAVQRLGLGAFPAMARVSVSKLNKMAVERVM